jgi:serine/threonine-protein kinase
MDHAARPTPLSAKRPAADAQPDLTGRTLGDFRVLRRLGQGGMGQVYLAEQIALKRKVALKLLRAELAADATALERFKIEAQAVARATHPNIVQVYAVGEADGIHYMALEFVEGRTLREHLEKKGSPELLVALSIMRQVASALQRASELGIVHRDIKPENILITRKTEVKVADFGLSRILAGDQASPSLTQSNITLGTPLYMSPEQVENRTLDPRSDIYSFGVTCYHMLAGQPPFRGETAFEVVLQHVQKPPPPLAQIRPDLPAELCALIHKMMAKRPEDRPQTGREIAKEVSRLRDALVGVAGAATGALVSMGPAATVPTDLVKTQPMTAMTRRRRLRWALAGSLVLALAGGLLLGRLQHRGAVAAQAVPEENVTLKEPQSEHKRKEAFLVQAFREYAQPKDPGQTKIGLELATELGLLYLKERRLEEAEQFFKQLAGKQQHATYRGLGTVGKAMVLAFRDQAHESNKLILYVLNLANKSTGGNPLGKVHWLSNRPLRTMLAEALNHNYANDPAAFPTVLEPLRHPPQPPSRIESKAK